MLTVSAEETPGQRLLDRLTLLDRLDREDEIRSLSPEVLELLGREVLQLSAIGAALAAAREANDWEAEIAVLTRWAEHEAVRRERLAARAARKSE